MWNPLKLQKQLISHSDKDLASSSTDLSFKVLTSGRDLVNQGNEFPHFQNHSFGEIKVQILSIRVRALNLHFYSIILCPRTFLLILVYTLRNGVLGSRRRGVWSGVLRLCCLWHPLECLEAYYKGS